MLFEVGASLRDTIYYSTYSLALLPLQFLHVNQTHHRRRIFDRRLGGLGVSRSATVPVALWFFRRSRCLIVES